MCLLLPLVIFYAILAREAVNLPILDDYDAILGFLNSLALIHGSGAKLVYILTAQHNEYKLIFEHSAVAAEYFISGRVNFLLLLTLGNAFVPLTLAVLWKMFRVPDRTASQRLLLFAPAPLLLLQLHYAETLDWSMGSLQNLPVIFFSLLSIYLLARPSSRCLWAACFSLVLAIASSGNGFLAAPAGLLMLLQFRRFRSSALWVLTTAAMAALYFYRYHFSTVRDPGAHSVLRWLGHIHLLYTIAFLGSAVAALKYPIGGLACLAVASASVRSYRRTHPGVYYSMLWILLTAVGVSSLRSGFGVEQSQAPRYTIYSVLLVILCYFFVAARVASSHVPHAWKAASITIFMVACFAVWLRGDFTGYQLLAKRKYQTIQGMAAWERTKVQTELITTLSGPPMKNFYESAQKKLQRSGELGIYRPPQY